MFSLIHKIIRTKQHGISRDELGPMPSRHDIMVSGRAALLHRCFKGSLAVRAVDSGSTNACEQELTALANPRYDVERFGVHFVASPRHADALMVTGPVARNMEEALKRTYEATPEPRIVIAVGDDAISGGIFKGSYGVLDGVDKVIPVDFIIPGDPPTPEDILRHLLVIIDTIGSRTTGA